MGNSYSSYMSNSRIHVLPYNSFKFERILDPTRKIIVGVSELGEGIRIGDDEIKYLQTIIEKENRIDYIFSDNVLSIEKRKDNIFLTLNNETSEITNGIIKLWKPIEYNSTNLDKIGKLFNI